MNVSISATIASDGETVNIRGLPWSPIPVGELYSDKFVANLNLNQAEMLLEELEYAIKKAKEKK